ncbi:hypothetical protein EcWSU1_02266 [Enterobacter ludwigii]|uniref:Uncharacterized protein n=1 Tax=Enterobacter ludwigii TaxID=299767 RepID=G8LQ53_9ENTR|nr:hypothetical protein EcWSU1_02266 [Enterobacter ludwigii]
MAKSAPGWKIAARVSVPTASGEFNENDVVFLGRTDGGCALAAS